MNARGQILAVVIVSLILPASISVRAISGEIEGMVKSVDARAGVIVVVPPGTREGIAVTFPGRATVLSPSRETMQLTDIRPGTHIIIDTRPVAAQIVVERELVGTLKSAAEAEGEFVLIEEKGGREVAIKTTDRTSIISEADVMSLGGLSDLEPGTPLSVIVADGRATVVSLRSREISVLGEFWDNLRHNLFKPLLLFFYAGFLIPVLKIKFEFPYVIYQGLTLYLLIAIGWHGGEELAILPAQTLGRAAGFMGVGFATNFTIGFLAYVLLRWSTPLRRIDAATVGGYYGSDSAGTFVTCLGVLTSAGIAYQPYMPVLLAVMEIPGCLVALFLISRLRQRGMDPTGTMPDEPGFDPGAPRPQAAGLEGDNHDLEKHGEVQQQDLDAVEEERELALEKRKHPTRLGKGPRRMLDPRVLHEVFLNPGIYLLFAGIAIGFLSRRQGAKVSAVDDPLFLTLFQGLLCLFLLEMGMTASRKIRDLRSAGWSFVIFGLAAPNLFATIGIMTALAYGHAIGQGFDLGTYVLFAVLCAAASYIAMPAIQRLAIPEASPTLPLAASLGLTFSYNVTLGIPIYIQIAKAATRLFPI